MTDTRREFIKKASLLTGAAGLFSVMPLSIQRAMAIDAAPGSTFMEAEHVVFLMQENRSFDHCFGTLKGVRGFNDPRAIRLADKNPVWLQTNAAGFTYAPFRLNIKDTNATWMSSLPHSWENQVDARNGGKHDKWLDSKKSGNKQFAEMPLTMGYYNREDIPFYYALADAFTVCDQHFSSALTGTSPNRLFFFTGTVRAKQNEQSKAHVWNGEIDHKDIFWTTFPERLEEMGISWKVYQNELSIPVGFKGEEEDWLANFTDNDLEFFKQYHVRLHPKHLEFMENHGLKLQKEIKTLQAKIERTPEDSVAKDQLIKARRNLDLLKKEQQEWNQERFDQLSEREKNIHKKAFVTNKNDPDYHQLAEMTYDDQGKKREMKVPKGDVLHQFRADLASGKLPTVSWLVPPSNFSDHPGSPWYGAWYISEVMDILTKNKEVWKKTIFIITYDENDGYFDHVPPFLPPNTAKPETGKASEGMDTLVEHVTMQQEAQRGVDKKDRRESAIGLGYRVPMLVISPWTKGGWVNSQVFDHTSGLQFLEHFLTQKIGKKIVEDQISDWRRTVCGDLTSVFRVAKDDQVVSPKPLVKEKFIQGIYNAKFKSLPAGFKSLSKAEQQKVQDNPLSTPLLPVQERGIRHSSALPYQLYVSGKYDKASSLIKMSFASGTDVFGKNTAGVPFTVYFPGKTMVEIEGDTVWDKMRSRYYAVKAGDKINDEFALNMFKDQQYHIQVNGPNGFFREFKGNETDPDVLISCEYQAVKGRSANLSGNVELKISNLNAHMAYEISVIDHAYHAKPVNLELAYKQLSTIIDLKTSYGWYDFSVKLKGNDVFEQRFAGRVETGMHSYTDPFMGRV